MRVKTRMWPGSVLIGLAAAGMMALPASASAHGSSPGPRSPAPHGSPVVGHVYVNDNTAPTNTIGAFDRHADGTLTPEPGSPFDAGGAGTGSGLASQGAIQISPNGRYLLAVDAGSNQISVLRISQDGSLELTHNGVVSSGGVLPDSIAIHSHAQNGVIVGGVPDSVVIHDDLVYVANSGNGGSNYTGFILSRGGHLRPISKSTFALPDDSAPADVLFDNTGTRLVGTRVGSSLIDSFTVGENGLLKAAPGSPTPAQGLGPFGSEFRPGSLDQLFVSNAHNVGAGTGTISAYVDSRNGTLSPVVGSPFADNQTAPCWIEITHDGRFLFTVNTGSGTISRYSIASDEVLTLLGSTPVSATGGVGAVDARLSPDGRDLYVDESRIGKVGEFAVSGGNLTELTGSPVSLPTGATPAGIATN